MNVQSLKQYIINNNDMIELILENSGFFHIKKLGDEYVCGWTYEGMGTSVHINVNTLKYYDFSIGKHGDIITLISESKSFGFKATVKYISKICGIDNIDFQKQKIEYPFGGYYKSVSKSDSNVLDINIKTYSEDILNKYILKPNVMFFKDGISNKVQEKYKIGYDIETGRIIVPWRDINGDIIGIMGRYNSREVPENYAKWIPVIEFPKSHALFGFSENYTHIISKDLCYIGESEKLPMQMESKNILHSIGNGGSIINEAKAEYIKSFGVKNLILLYDEGVEEEFIRVQAKKIKSNNPFYKNNVGYVFDKDNKFLPKKSKMSPSDLYDKKMRQLIKERLIWI